MMWLLSVCVFFQRSRQIEGSEGFLPLLGHVFEPEANIGDIVSTECGSVKGHVVGEASVYHGIRYATAEEWRLPRNLTTAHECWAPAILEAMKPGPQCYDLFGLGTSAKNCLHLNVWAPLMKRSGQGGLRPVMVYFHGGDLTMGTNNWDFGKLAAHGNGVIVVDVSYRLNLAGFLSVDAMATESPTKTSGMYGIYDMIESLRWVGRNVAFFGGDPERVTIFGQSSGATAVNVLVASPITKGLFSGAMSLSGSSNITKPAIAQREEHAHILSSAWCDKSTPAKIMECLRGRGQNMFGFLWQAEPKGGDHTTGTEVNPSWGQWGNFDAPGNSDGLRNPALAVVDGDILREPLEDALRFPRNDVPFIVSSMSEEIAFWPIRHHLHSFDAESLHGVFSYKPRAFIERLVEQYKSIGYISPQRAYDNLVSDLMVSCGALGVAKAAAQSFTSPVYRVYNEQPNMKGDFHGLIGRGSAYHGYDLEYATSGDGPEAILLRDLWHEFAATGKVASWKRMPRGNGSITMRLVNGTQISSVDWKESDCIFWKSAGFGPEFQWST